MFRALLLNCKKAKKHIEK